MTAVIQNDVLKLVWPSIYTCRKFKRAICFGHCSASQERLVIALYYLFIGERQEEKVK